MQIRGRILVDIRAFYLLVRHHRKLPIVGTIELNFRTSRYAAVRRSIEKLEIQLIPRELAYAGIVSASVRRNIRTAYAKRHVVLAVHRVLPAHDIAVFVSLAIPDLYVILREFSHVVVFYTGQIRLRKTLYVDDASCFPVNICLHAVRFNLNGISARHVAIKPLLMKRAFQHPGLQLRRLRKHIRIALYLAIPDRVGRQLRQIYVFALLRNVRVE